MTEARSTFYRHELVAKRCAGSRIAVAAPGNGLVHCPECDGTVSVRHRYAGGTLTSRALTYRIADHRPAPARPLRWPSERTSPLMVALRRSLRSGPYIENDAAMIRLVEAATGQRVKLPA